VVPVARVESFTLLVAYAIRLVMVARLFVTTGAACGAVVVTSDGVAVADSVVVCSGAAAEGVVAGCGPHAPSVSRPPTAKAAVMVCLVIPRISQKTRCSGFRESSWPRLATAQ
jgi:hypothetical protein